MRDSKVDLLGNLVRYINTLEKGHKTIVFMTALLLSWEEMEASRIEKIINDTVISCAVYDDRSLPLEEGH